MYKYIIILLFALCSTKSYTQTYNPALGLTTNKSVGIAQGVPTDFRSMFWDNTNFVARDYASKTEVITTFAVNKYRLGHATIFIHNGGALGGNGVWVGGTTDIYLFKDSTDINSLVLWNDVQSVNGRKGVVVIGNADSIRNKVVDFSTVYRNNYLLAIDTAANKIFLTPPASGYTAGTGIDITGQVVSALNTQALWNANTFRGRSISTTAPNVGNIYKWNGVSWVPSPDLSALDTAYFSNDTLYLVGNSDTSIVVLNDFNVLNDDFNVEADSLGTIHFEVENTDNPSPKTGIDLNLDSISIHADNIHYTQIVNKADSLKLIYANNAAVKKYIKLDTAAITIVDNINSFGQKYGADYSTNGKANPRWLPDIAAVRNTIHDSSGNYIKPSDTASMLLPYVRAVGYGLTKTGQSVKLDSATVFPDIRATIPAGASYFNSNIGSFYRLATPNTNNIKTLAPGYGILNDSTSNSNAITQKADTTKLATLVALQDSMNYLACPAETTFGRIYKDSLWTNNLNFTTHGTAILSVNNGNLDFTGGDGTFNNYATVATSPTLLPNWRIKIRFKLTAWSGSSFGIGIGLRSINTITPGDILGFVSTTSATPATQFISESNSGSPIVSGTSPVINLNDIVEMTATFNDSTFIITTQNITTSSALFSSSYSFINTSPVSNILPNTCLFSLYEFGGTHQIQSIDISSPTIKNTTLISAGDSKTQAYYAGTFTRRYGWQLKNNFTSSIIYAGGGDQTTDFIKNVPELLKLRPVQVVLQLGSNDIRGGRSLSATIATYDSITNYMLSAGIRVYHMVLPEDSTAGGTGMTAFKNYIAVKYASNYIDTWDSLSTGNRLKTMYYISDGIHPNGLGNDKIYQTILASGYLTNFPVRRSQFSTSDGVVNFTGDSLYFKYKTALNANYVPRISSGADSLVNSDIIDGGLGYVGIRAQPTNLFPLTVGGTQLLQGPEAGIVFQNRNTSTNYWSIESMPSLIINDLLHSTVPLIIDTLGRVGIGQTPTTTFEVNGGAKFHNNVSITNNGAFINSLNISNTTANSGAGSAVILTSDAGLSQIFKYSTLGGVYKVWKGSDMVYYNSTAGNITIDNDYSLGNINLTAGGSSTSHLTIAPYGYVGVGLTSPLQRLHVHGQVQIDTLTNGTAGTDSVLVQSAGVIKRISPTYYSAGAATTIYNGDGALSGNRIVTLSTNYLNFSGTSAIGIPAGTIAQRPTGAVGYLRANTDSSNIPEYYNGIRYSALADREYVINKITTQTASGTYTPTFTNTTNITSSSLTQASYIRTGNIVHVSIGGTLNATVTSTASTLTFTLPITTSTTTQSYVGDASLAYNAGSLGTYGGLISIASGTTGTLSFTPTVAVAGSINFNVQFDYVL